MMLRRFSILSCLALASLFPCHGSAGEVPMIIGGYAYEIPMESMKESRFRTVVHQKYDFSCGSAALATLLQYHYDWPANEQDIVLSMLAIGDKEKIRREGFSLLDMKRYLASIGFQANGFRADLKKLEQVGIPAIVLINHSGYLHFVVIKGIRKDVVLIGDPALGLKVVNREKFEKMWNNIVFVIMNEKEYARSTFDREEEWHTSPKANFDVALDSRTLASFAVQITPTPNYYY